MLELKTFRAKTVKWGTAGPPFALPAMPTPRCSSLFCAFVKDGKEVDFCLVLDNRPELLIEVKRSDPEPARGGAYFHDRYAIPAVQLVLHLKREKHQKRIEIREAGLVRIYSRIRFNSGSLRTMRSQ